MDIEAKPARRVRAMPAAETGPAVRVNAPGRLHLGFLDPGGSLGRAFGSLGLTLEAPVTRVELQHAPRDRFSGPAALQGELDRAVAHLQRLREVTKLAAPLRLCLLRALPAHAGFGSGTQLALAVGRAFAAVHGLELSTAELARVLGRGLRSGVGVAGFDRGGLLLDGGPGRNGVAPLIARAEFPAAWRIVLAIDPHGRGLHGEAERRAIAAMAPLPAATAAAICHQVLLRVLPAVHEADFTAFAAGVSAIQRWIGDYYAPAQGGGRFTSPAIGRVIDWIGAEFGAGVGQSSWGPTGFAILPSQAGAEAAVRRARATSMAAATVQLVIVAARNAGARIDFIPIAEQDAHDH
jgi:beta-RFAP synthase